MKPEIKERIDKIKRGEMPDGYKTSKIGVIPEDWDVKHLEDISNINPRKEVLDENDTVSFISMSDVSDDARLISYQPRLYKEVFKGFTAFRDRDVLVAKITPCFENGKGALVDNLINKTGFGSTEFHVLRSKKNGDELFIYYHTVTDRFRKIGEKNMTGTAGQKRISTDFVKGFLIPYPRNDIERKKITSILSTWDKAIELKEKLIEQKKKQKKGLMQKLLTGEVRLPGYSGDWKKVKLGEILKERKETGYIELELLAITSSKGVVKRTEVDIKDNSSEDKSKYKRILPNDIGYNTMRMWQGVSGVSKYEGIVSPAYTILKPTNKVNSNFIGYLFKLPKIINLFRRYSQGLVSDTLNLKYENLKGIKVTIPQDVEEQKKIAEILLSIDNEIEMLQEYVNYLKQQKKGLMQLLLTGKVRVKV